MLIGPTEADRLAAKGLMYVEPSTGRQLQAHFPGCVGAHRSDDAFAGPGGWQWACPVWVFAVRFGYEHRGRVGLVVGSEPWMRLHNLFMRDRRREEWRVAVVAVFSLALSQYGVVLTGPISLGSFRPLHRRPSASDPADPAYFRTRSAVSAYLDTLIDIPLETRKAR